MNKPALVLSAMLWLLAHSSALFAGAAPETAALFID